MPDLQYLRGRASDLYRNDGVSGLLAGINRFVVSMLDLGANIHRLRYWLRQHIVGFRHGPVPHAFDLIWIDPSTITALSSTNPTQKWRRSGLVVPGGWDRECRSLAEYDLVRAIERRYGQERAWENTDFYSRVQTEIERGHTKWGCQSAEEFDSRCAAIDELYRSIRDNGYLTKQQITERISSVPVTDGHTVTHSSSLRQYDEVCVDIDRTGSFLLVDGRHRVALASVLEVDRIPVRVVQRHESWQAERNKAREGGVEIGTHPDLPDL